MTTSRWWWSCHTTTALVLERVLKLSRMAGKTGNREEKLWYVAMAGNLFLRHPRCAYGRCGPRERGAGANYKLPSVSGSCRPLDGRHLG